MKTVEPTIHEPGKQNFTVVDTLLGLVEQAPFAKNIYNDTRIYLPINIHSGDWLNVLQTNITAYHAQVRRKQILAL